MLPGGEFRGDFLKGLVEFLNSAEKASLEMVTYVLANSGVKFRSAGAAEDIARKIIANRDFADHMDIMKKVPELNEGDLYSMIELLDDMKFLFPVEGLAKIMKEKALKAQEAQGEAGPTADAAGGGTYRNSGPGGKKYRETGELYRIALDGFIDSTRAFLPRVIGPGHKPVTIRVPVEELDLIGEENARDFLSAFKRGNGSNLKIALFRSGTGSVTNEDYARFGMIREELDIVPSRSNTVTLFVCGKDDDLGTNIDMMERIGMMDPEDTILIPVGMYDDGKDLAGLIRSTLLGLRLIHIANGEYNKAFIDETLGVLKDLSGVSTISKFDLDEKDIMDLVRSNYNRVKIALDKLKKLLPIIPLDEEELRRAYQHDREAMLAA
jgi:hypothetical protein